MSVDRLELARLDGVEKRFGPVVALDRLSLSVHAGEVLAVLGRNGAGKTTAIGVCTGRIRADAGSVAVQGRDPRTIEARRVVGAMLQDCRLPDTLQVIELVRLFSSYYPQPRPLAETLALAGLAMVARKRYGDLSGGQKQRLALALAICGRPRLLFFDEPSVGLDVEARRALWQTVAELRNEGCGIVLTTHYLDEADALADRVVLIDAGRTLAEDRPARLKARVAGKRIRACSALDHQTIAAWPETGHVRTIDGRIEIVTTQPESLLRRWLAVDADLTALEVVPASLEDAVIALSERARSAADTSSRPSSSSADSSRAGLTIADSANHRGGINE